jgi:hypothetical protein
MRIVTFVLLTTTFALTLSCDQATDAPRTTSPLPFVGAWAFYKSMSLDSIYRQRWDTTVTHEGFLLPGDSIDPQVMLPSLVITPTQIYQGWYLDTITCHPTHLRFYDIVDSELYRRDWVSNAWYVPRPLGYTLKSCDTLVYCDSFNPFSKVISVFVRESTVDASIFCPDTQLSRSTCRTYACDTTLPLALAFYDNTPLDTTDPGCYVYDVRLRINGKPVLPTQARDTSFRHAFAFDRDNIMLPRNLPLAHDTYDKYPVIVQFSLSRSSWRFADSSDNTGVALATVTVEYATAGNCRVALLSGEQDFCVCYMAGLIPTPPSCLGVILEDRVVYNSPKITGISETDFNTWCQQAAAAGFTATGGQYNAGWRSVKWF